MHRIFALIVTLLIVCGAEMAVAQTSISSAMRDTSIVSTDTGAFHMTKSPLTAVLLSAVLPGAGQVYLGQAWKLPIIYGLVGGFAYGVIIQNARYHWAIDSVNSEMAMAYGPDSSQAYQRSQAFASTREFYRNDRDKWWIYLGLTYIADIIDAYVASNLYDFDVSNPSPSMFQSFYDPVAKTVGMLFTLRF
jgi:hypothetical protein